MTVPGLGFSSTSQSRASADGRATSGTGDFIVGSAVGSDPIMLALILIGLYLLWRRGK